MPSPSNRLGWRVRPVFQITLHKKDTDLLEHIQNSFGVGSIYSQGPQSIQFRVESIKELSTIINHFDKYPLITHKQADYPLFVQANIFDET